ncbi:acetyl-CoA carboxylase biotin carboxyl carrier protein [Rhodovibrionaceae bacterium A322]
MGKFPLDEKAVRTLATILDDTNLTEIEVEAGDHCIRVARTANSVAVAAPAPVAAAPAPVAAAAAPVAAAPAAAGGALPEGAVTSPMVGTAYLASEPGSPAFVQVGDQVKEGQTLLIIEAMKVMNALPAPRGGTVTEILVQDGQPVEFGEPLLVIS